MDTTTAHGELLFGLFGALAQYERALAGLVAARRRGRVGGRPRLIDQEKFETMIRALEAGATKASLCRTFNVRRSTLNDAIVQLAADASLHAGRPRHPRSARAGPARCRPW